MGKGVTFSVTEGRRVRGWRKRESPVTKKQSRMGRVKIVGVTKIHLRVMAFSHVFSVE